MMTGEWVMEPSWFPHCVRRGSLSVDRSHIVFGTGVHGTVHEFVGNESGCAVGLHVSCEMFLLVDIW